MQSRSMHAHLLRIVRLLAAVVMVVGTTSVAFSQAPEAKKTKKYVATKEIVRDQVTGQLRKPTDGEIQTMVDTISTLTNRSADGLTVAQHQNGMKSMKLDGRLSGVVLGRAMEDGTVEVRCVTTLDEAIEFLGLEESTTPQQ